VGSGFLFLGDGFLGGCDGRRLEETGLTLFLEPVALPFDVDDRGAVQQAVDYRVIRKAKRLGSLGHPRYLALAQWRGGLGGA
jgi:hypothetical protein